MQLTNDELRLLQKVELDIFSDFIEVCKKLNVKYYLIAGTLLGAVRHKGFIPWDDDIDVGIAREDYDRFLKDAPALLPKHLFLQTYQTDPEYPHVFAKIRNTNTTFIEAAVKDNKINHGIYIDIFPLDFCYADCRQKRRFKWKERLLTMRISAMYSGVRVSKKTALFQLLSKIVSPSAKRALQRLDALYKSEPRGDKIANFSGIYGAREIMPIEWYGAGVDIEFEGLKATAPTQYDKWLTQVYGDYMKYPPEEKRVTHHDTIKIDINQSYKQYEGDR